MATLAGGFATPQQLRNHFQSHGMDFGAATEMDYEFLAKQFLAVVVAPPVQECIRKYGDIVRFNAATDEFCVMSISGLIRTFFRPRPCHTLPLSQRAIARTAKRCHDFASNQLYYQAACIQ
jgi:hypothetical protein